MVVRVPYETVQDPSLTPLLRCPRGGTYSWLSYAHAHAASVRSAYSGRVPCRRHSHFRETETGASRNSWVGTVPIDPCFRFETFAIVEPPAQDVTYVEIFGFLSYTLLLLENVLSN